MTIVWVRPRLAERLLAERLLAERSPQAWSVGVVVVVEGTKPDVEATSPPAAEHQPGSPLAGAQPRPKAPPRLFELQPVHWNAPGGAAAEKAAT